MNRSILLELAEIKIDDLQAKLEMQKAANRKCRQVVREAKALAFWVDDQIKLASMTSGPNITAQINLKMLQRVRNKLSTTRAFVATEKIGVGEHE